MYHINLQMLLFIMVYCNLNDIAMTLRVSVAREDVNEQKRHS